MSESFQSCPKCECFILSDTFECPECGYVLDEERARVGQAASASDDMKSMGMYDTCNECGESVRTGLVRCWNCNSFMRPDVEERYKKMTSTPQPIIFSDVPQEERTEFMPARDSDGHVPWSRVYDADDADGFTLRTDGSVGNADASQADDDGFELEAGVGTTSTPAATPTPKSVPAEAKTEEPSEAPAEKETQENAENKKQAKQPPKAPGDFDADDLVGIALQDQRETRRKKRAKLKEAKRQRILLPCSCGAWIRVHQDQAGRVVRCRQCKNPVVVPVMKKKDKTSDKEKSKSSDIKVAWLNEVRLHVIQPTDVTLKPGSLEKTFDSVDLGFHESGLHVIQAAPPAKKSFFSKATDGPPSVDEQRKLVREHVAKTGAIADLPFGELFSVPSEQISNIRLIQPVKEAHASMFAGVPVFGDGQIAIYLPLPLPDNQQAFLSFPISMHRKIAEQLKSLFKFDVGAEDNGVPASEEFDTLRCHLTEMPVRSLKNVVYYENDPAFELELSGHVCTMCGIAITEDARAKKKLGGAAGKGIAKAKCPKCSNKFGDQKAWNVAKAPDDEQAEEEEDVSEVLQAKPEPAAAESEEKTPTTSEKLQGTWKMVSLAQDGNFASPNDVSGANILFIIDGDNYTVSAGDEVQEKGTITVDEKQDPPQLDQHITEGTDAGKAHLGIYRIVDGRLENCQGALDQPRPASFESEAESTASLAVFERS